MSITCYWGLQLEVNIAVGIVRVKDLAGAHQSPLVPLCSIQVAAKNVHCPACTRPQAAECSSTIFTYGGVVKKKYGALTSVTSKDLTQFLCPKIS